jgi:hypothetical protein
MVITTAITTITLAATIFAPAGFGSGLREVGLWNDEPIVLAVPPIVAPGDTLDCAIQFEEKMAEPEEPVELGTAANDAKHVTVYSDPPGVIYYSGTVTGSSAVISANVSPAAEPGPVTVYVQSGTSDPISTSTTVVRD